MRKRSAYRPKYSSPRGWVGSRLLGTEPWRIAASIDPIEQIIDQIEHTGTVDSARGEVIFRDTGSQDYYSAVPALRGVVEFYETAAARKRWPLELKGIERLWRKLDLSCPLTQGDIDAARADIAEIRRYAPTLTLAEADDLVNTVKISQEFERIRAA
jgi:hypothetical protein